PHQYRPCVDIRAGARRPFADSGDGEYHSDPLRHLRGRQRRAADPARSHRSRALSAVFRGEEGMVTAARRLRASGSIRRIVERLALAWKRARMLYRVLLLVRFNVLLGVVGGLVL